MATITALPTNAPRTRQGRRDRMRGAWSTARRQAATAVSAARHRDWSPEQSVAGLTSGVASAWTTFGLGAGLLALMGAFFAFDWSRD